MGTVRRPESASGSERGNLDSVCDRRGVPRSRPLQEHGPRECTDPSLIGSAPDVTPHHPYRLHASTLACPGLQWICVRGVPGSKRVGAAGMSGRPVFFCWVFGCGTCGRHGRGMGWQMRRHRCRNQESPSSALFSSAIWKALAFLRRSEIMIPFFSLTFSSISCLASALSAAKLSGFMRYARKGRLEVKRTGYSLESR